MLAQFRIVFSLTSLIAFSYSEPVSAAIPNTNPNEVIIERFNSKELVISKYPANKQLATSLDATKKTSYTELPKSLKPYSRAGDQLWFADPHRIAKIQREDKLPENFKVIYNESQNSFLISGNIDFTDTFERVLRETIKLSTTQSSVTFTLYKTPLTSQYQKKSQLPNEAILLSKNTLVSLNSSKLTWGKSNSIQLHVALSEKEIMNLKGTQYTYTLPHPKKKISCSVDVTLSRNSRKIIEASRDDKNIYLLAITYSRVNASNQSEPASIF